MSSPGIPPLVPPPGTVPVADLAPGGIPGGHVVTLWGWGQSLWDSWRSERTQRLLAAARPTGVQLHGSWSHLISTAPRTTQSARDAGYAVVWGIAGDGESHEDRDGANAAARWPQVAEAAAKAEADALVINAEGPGRADRGYGWTKHDIPQVRAALAGMRGAYDGPIGHTSFGWPIWSEQHRYGGIPAYPWAEFVGPGTCDFHHPQVYYGASFRAHLARYHAYDWSWGRAGETGLCDPELPRHIYLACATDEGHKPTDPAGNIWSASMHRSVFWWTSPDYDEAGYLSVVCASRLYAAGYGCPIGEQYRPSYDDDGVIEPTHVLDSQGRRVLHPVARYQTDAGLPVNGECTPETRARILG